MEVRRWTPVNVIPICGVSLEVGKSRGTHAKDEVDHAGERDIAELLV
jgi:hypothetical protein